MITLAVVAEGWGWDEETEALQHWHDYRHLFPNVPERSRFHRRRRALAEGINLIRCLVLELLDVAQDRQCVIDSLPMPVIPFHLVPGAVSKVDWQAAGATFGEVSSKQQTSFGFKLHLLVTMGGVIRDVVLALALCGGRAISGKALAHIFEIWLPARGVVGIHAHRLRHTFATEMLRAGAGLAEISEALGHTDISTAQIYLRVDVTRIRGAIDRLPTWY